MDEQLPLAVNEELMERWKLIALSALMLVTVLRPNPLHEVNADAQRATYQETTNYASTQASVSSTKNNVWSYAPESYNNDYRDPRTQDEIKEYIRQEAIRQGVSTTVALWIAEKESSYINTAVGDQGQSRGIWQIHKGYNPSVKDEAAFSVESSTQWALTQIKNGRAYLWTTYKYCKRYPTCPL